MTKNSFIAGVTFKMMLTKHIFDYHPITEKKHTGSWVHGISKGIAKSKQKFENQLKKEVDFLGVIKKKSCAFSIGLGFLVLEFPRGVAQICGIFRGESLFSKVKVTNIEIPRVFSKMYIYHQPTPSLDFSWNSPILMKRGWECLTCMSPTSLPKSDLGT